MKLEELIENLKKEASEEITRLHYGFENQIRDLEQSARLERMHLDEGLEKQIEKEENELKKQIIGKANLECKKNILKEKKRLVNLAIDEGINKLMTTKKYETFLINSIKKEKNAKIYGNKNDKILKKLTKYKTTDIKAGIILEKKDIIINKNIETITVSIIINKTLICFLDSPPYLLNKRVQTLLQISYPKIHPYSYIF